MKLIRTEDAAGQVLCHDITQILPGEFKGPRFRKGHIVQPEDIPVLLSIGKENLYVWEKTPGILHEDEATALLTIYDMCKAVDKGMELGEIHLEKKSGGKSGLYIRAEGGYV